MQKMLYFGHFMLLGPSQDLCYPSSPHKIAQCPYKIALNSLHAFICAHKPAKEQVEIVKERQHST